MRRALQSTLRKVALVLLLGLGLAAPVSAVDGVIEINQVKALAGGVTAGDTAGFPVTIDAAGSYRLTSNLDVTGEPTPENVTAVLIVTADVTVDLNGFAIIGPTTCTISCSPTGTGYGVHALNPRSATVINGTVRGMGNIGVAVGSSSRVEAVSVIQNGGVGILVANSGMAVGNNAENNGSHGISVVSGVVRDNVSFFNDGDGLKINEGVVTGNHATRNGANGISCGLNSAVICTVRGNTVAENGGFGLNLSVHSGYTDNVVKSNTGGSVSGGIQMGINVCNGNTTCP